MDVVDADPGGQLLRRVAEGPLDGRVDVAHDVVGAEQDHHVVGVLRRPTEVLLAALRFPLRLLVVGELRDRLRLSRLPPQRRVEYGLPQPDLRLHGYGEVREHLHLLVRPVARPDVDHAESIFCHIVEATAGNL
jgi:hypothetical protein